jgi:CBS domain-containing protein
VATIMTPLHSLETVGPNEEVADAMRTLGRRDVEQLPVVQDGRLVGVLRRRDILRWLELQNPGPARPAASPPVFHH